MPLNKFVFPHDEVLKRMKPKELDDLTTHALGMSVNKGGKEEIPAGLLIHHHAETLSQDAEKIINVIAPVLRMRLGKDGQYPVVRFVEQTTRAAVTLSMPESTDETAVIDQLFVLKSVIWPIVTTSAFAARPAMVSTASMYLSFFILLISIFYLIPPTSSLIPHQV